MADYYIGAGRPQKLSPILTMMGDVRSISVDLTVWADDNASVTTVTWTVDSGPAVIAADSVTNSVATALIRTAEAGNSVIKAVATSGIRTIALYLNISTQDPNTIPISDYWPCI